ncbi:pirin family protein [Kribbella sandramycini]|uniref:Pirin family protein n=1 Tax=Kribbella sandramycini TaxID=60450 RepID=A0A7Y4KV79_9ACTN|nr:pirin family protein [Kribbella sandramycini]MBB6568248.1 redox-sensitive bicupin YhaK (pirin superfamily) [Kribbella sandramycini]NOL39159.1 pirin family protein [Kribbella sandramycini]
MSDLEKDPAEVVCSGGAQGPVFELLEPREVVLGRSTKVRRLLPNKNRRMVGAWCFVDHYGPDDLSGRVDPYDVPGERGMLVPPHPHTSLQTVSWLFEGEIEHRDSVGSHALVRPGELNIMTAGNGIAHSEVSTPDAPPTLHGAQLWVALPDAVRSTVAPAFNAYADLPRADLNGGKLTVMIGTVAGVTSPAPAYTPLVGADLTIDPGRTIELPLTPANEYAVLVVDGALTVGDLTPTFGQLAYLGAGRESIHLVASDNGVRCLLLGGEPFTEELVMWWNFIGRTHEEILQARTDWTTALTTGHPRFPTVPGYEGAPLPAPPLPATTLKPRPRTR